MYEESSIETKMCTQEGTNRSHRNRNMSPKLKDCVGTPDDVVDDEGELVDSTFDANIEPVNVTKTLKNPIWAYALIEELNSTKANKNWSLVDLPRGKKVINVK